MILNYTKTVNDLYVYYTFNISDIQIRVSFYKTTTNELITSTKHYADVIYGKLSNIDIGKYPRFGIVFETIAVNNTDLYDTIIDIAKDFLLNYNNSISFNLIKVDVTDSLETKRDEILNRLKNIFPDLKLKIINKNSDISKQKFIIKI